MFSAFDTHATEIDMERWERRSLFELFSTFSEPFHGVCLRVDCTETFRFAKQNGLSMFLSLQHRSLRAAQDIEAFKTRIVDGKVYSFRTIHAGSAVGRANGTIGFGHYIYRPSVVEFAREGAKVLERVKAENDLERYPYQNLIRYSVLPWFDFTSISHARDDQRPDSAPRITFGKITDANGRKAMPVSIHAHHALADGSHVAEFVERFEMYLAKPEVV
ncbi:MAG: CatA-like O-acetyltransferase [Acidobacteriaceae bacterium]|nr:CatA-like O-acetyltransferase [Acidobacteriaceae bacterium]